MKKDIESVISMIAMQEGISEQEVLKHMQEAIDSGYYDNDPAIRARWDAMPFASSPTPQEFMDYICNLLTVWDDNDSLN